ncbi:putative Ig domain-containing protein [Lysobacter terrae]
MPDSIRNCVSGRRHGLLKNFAFALLCLGAMWSSAASAATSTYCPAPLTATVANGGSVSIDASTCDGPFDGGLSGTSPLTTAHGTATIGANSGGVQLVTYVHNGDSATSDTFTFLDNDNNDVVFNITISAPTSAIVVSPATLPAMTAGAAFSQTLSSTGGTAPYTYTVSGGTLVPGLSLSSTGVISGTPTQRGAYSFSVRSLDSLGASTDKGYTGTVQNPSLSISPTSASAFQGVAFSQTLTPSGGVAPHTFLLESGSLPAGITLSGSGVLSGTTSVSPASFPIVVRVTDASTGPGSYFELENFTLNVVAPPPVTVSPTTLPNATVGAAYSQTLTASGGTTPPFTFAVTAGALPAGLSLSSTGALTGTPTAGGSFNFTITATDSAAHSGSRAYALTVNAPTVSVSPTTLPSATAGSAYSQTITASGGTATYTFAITAGALPAGLTLSSGGALSGTPTAGGTFNFTVTATDSSTGTGPYTGSRAYSLTVNAPTISVSPTTLPGATEASAYSQTITASGGTSPHSFAITAGALPAGLVLSSAGTLSGTPTANGTFNFTVTATDSSTGTGPYTGSRAYSLVVAPQAPPTANPVSATVAFNSGANPITLNITGSVPTSVAVATAASNGTAIASGTSITYQPNTGFVGSDSFTYTATNSGGTSAPATVTITVTGPPVPVANAVSATVAFNSGANPITLNITGGVPTSVAIGTAPANGTAIASGTSITYQPNVGYSGSDSFTYTASNLGGTSAPATVSITVSAPTIVVSPSTLPNGVAGAAYSQTLSGSGGTSPYTFSLVSGALPVGMSLSSAGVFSGTPITAGTFNFTVRATDANGFTGDQAYSVVIAAPTITVAPASLPNGTAGVAYSQTFTGSGGAAPYSFSLVSGSLPVGMSFSSAGVFSGTPITAGTFNFTVRATDANGFTGDQAYSVVIAAPTITVSPASLPNGTAGVAYSQTFTGGGGAAPYSFSLVSGSLPVGMSFSSAGVFSGTPITAGTFNFTVRATDANGFTGDQAYSVVIAAPTITLSPSTLPNGVRGIAYAQTLTASGGTSPYSYALVSGSLPVGIGLSSSGAFSGTPTTAGSYTFSVSATDTLGFSGTQGYTVTIAESVPVAVNDAATTLGATPATVAVTTNDTGVITSIAVATAPAHGTATVSGLNIVYTASAGYSGNDTFTYQAIGPGGTSAPATVTITINPMPVAAAQTTSVMGGLSVTVDLTQGASGGPFTAATVVSLTPATSGTATIAPVGGSYRLTYTPVTGFSGQAVVQFTLSNAFATSAPATVTIDVAPRPDPSRDAEVRGLIDAQVEATRRFASAQIGNFQQRLENLHGSGRDGAGFSNGLGFAASRRCLDAIGRKPGDVCNLVASNDAVAMPTADEDERGSVGGRLGTWIGGVIRSGNQDGRGGGEGADFESDGVSAGLDYRFSPAFTFGGGIGYGRDDSDIGDNGSRAEGDATTLALYASYAPGETFFVDGLAGYQRLSYDLRRFVGATGGYVEGSRDGSQWFASISAGAQFQRGDMQLTPYARVDVARATLDGYAEHGDPIYSLVYGDQDVDTTTGNLGLRWQFHHDTNWGAFVPQFRVEYQHDFKTDSAVTLQYVDLPTGPLYRADVDGFDRNRVMVGFGAMFYLQRDFSIRVEYRGVFGKGDDADNAVMLNFEKGY